MLRLRSPGGHRWGLLMATSQQTSGNETAEEAANNEAEEKLEEIKGIGKKEGDAVIENLLRAVTDVRPQAPDRS